MEDMEEKQARNNIVVGCNLKMLYDLLRHIFGDFSFPLFFEHIPAVRGCVCGVFARFFLPAKCSRMHRLTSPLLVLQLKHDNSRKCRLTIEGNIISSFSVALKIRNRPKFRQLNLPLPQHGPAVHSPSVLKNERPTHFD